VAAVAPGLATTPAARGAGSEAAYTVLVVTATWWAVSAADRTGPGRLVRSAAAGACVALAYLARPEGLLLAAPLGVGLAVASFRRPPSLGLRMRDAGTVVVPVLAAFARHHGARWLVVDRTSAARVFRLDPPPGPAATAAPGLGFMGDG
jgi:hypothetical protein